MLFLTDRRLVWEVVKLKKKGSFRVNPSGLALDAVARVADPAVGAVLSDGSGVMVPLDRITGVRGDPGRHSILLVDTRARWRGTDWAVACTVSRFSFLVSRFSFLVSRFS